MKYICVACYREVANIYSNDMWKDCVTLHLVKYLMESLLDRDFSACHKSSMAFNPVCSQIKFFAK